MKWTVEKYRCPEWTAFRVEGWRMHFSEAEREQGALCICQHHLCHSVFVSVSLWSYLSHSSLPLPSTVQNPSINPSILPPLCPLSGLPQVRCSGTECCLWTSQWLSLSHFHITFSISLSRSMTLGSVRGAVWAFSFRRLFLYSRILSSW